MRRQASPAACASPRANSRLASLCSRHTFTTFGFTTQSCAQRLSRLNKLCLASELIWCSRCRRHTCTFIDIVMAVASVSNLFEHGLMSCASNCKASCSAVMKLASSNNSLTDFLCAHWWYFYWDDCTRQAFYQHLFLKAGISFYRKRKL